MNILSFFCIILFISFIYLGGHILRVDHKAAINRLFFLLCLSLSLAALFAGIVFSAGNKEDAFFWYKVAISFVFFFQSLNLQFNLALTGKKIKAAYQTLLHLPPVFLIMLTFTSTTCYSGCFRYGDHWAFTISPYTFGFIFYLLFIVSYAVPVIIVLLNWKRKAREQRIKKQARLILAAYCAGIALSFFFDIVVILLKIYPLSTLGPVVVFVYIAGLWYALVKYKFLSFRPSMAVNGIISNIQEMVFFLNPQMEILTVNNKCRELLSYDSEEISGKSFYDLVQGKDQCETEMTSLYTGAMKSFRIKLQYHGKHEPVFTDTYFAGVSDDFGDLIGILAVSRENMGLKQFKSRYKITERQLEIVNYSIAGLSNMEMCEKTGLAERTIETHLFNIYHKLGINNKIELFNIAREYNLI